MRKKTESREEEGEGERKIDQRLYAKYCIHIKAKIQRSCGTAGEASQVFFLFLL
jgi:hypothetical protein